MLNVSNGFKNAIKQLSVYSDGKVSLTNSSGTINFNDIMKIDVSASAFDNGKVIGNLAQYALTVELLGDQTSLIDLTKENIINVEFGVLVGAAYEYVPYQDFIVMSVNYSDTTNLTKITATDALIKLNKEYIDTNVYPMSLYDYAVSVLNFCNLELENLSFFNGDFVVETQPFSNYSNCREIIKAVAELSLNFAAINKVSGKVEFKKAYDRFMRGYTHEELEAFTHEELSAYTHYELMNVIPMQDENLTKDHYWSFKLKDHAFGNYGVNTVIIKSSQITGEETISEEPSFVALDGTIAITIADNQFVIDDTRRTQAIDGMLSEVVGYKYEPYTLEYRGFPYLEIGDIAAITRMDNSLFYSPIFDVQIRYDGGLYGKITTDALSKNATIYQNTNTLAKRVKNAEVIVDKVNGEVSILAGDYYDGKLEGAKYVFDGELATFYGGGLKIKNNFDEDVFYADVNGNLTLTGTITGSTIVGSVLKTSETDDRIEIANDTIQAYLNDISRVKLDYETLKFYDSNAKLSATLTASTFHFEMSTYGSTNPNQYSVITLSDTDPVGNEQAGYGLYSFNGTQKVGTQGWTYADGRDPITLLIAETSPTERSYIWLENARVDLYSTTQTYRIFYGGSYKTLSIDANGFVKAS